MATNATRNGTARRLDPGPSSESSPHNFADETVSTCPISDERWTPVVDALRLSPRELEIVRHLFDAKSEAMIAREMGLSIHTVHSHFVRLYRKVGVHDRCELVLRIFSVHCAGCRAPTCNQDQPT